MTTACLSYRRMPYSSYAWNALGVAQGRQGQLREALESLSPGDLAFSAMGRLPMGELLGCSRYSHEHNGIPWHLYALVATSIASETDFSVRRENLNSGSGASQT